MRVGIFLGNLTPQWGGAFTFEKSMIDALSSMPHQAHEFFVFYSGKMPEITVSKNVHLVPLANNPLFPVERNLQERIKSRLNRLFGTDRLDLQIRKLWHEVDDLNFKRHFNNSLNSAVIENRIDLLWFPSMCMVPVQIPFVVTLWDLAHRQLPVFPELNVSGATWEEREKVYQAFMRKAVRVFMGTESACSELSFFYNIPKSQTRTIAMPVPEHLTKVMPNKDFPQEISQPFIFYPAQFWPHKNHIACLLTLKELKNKYQKNFDLVLTGSDKGNQTFIKDKAREMGLERNVHFLGFVSAEALAWLYKNAHVMMFPTFLGPDNIPPLEAFALGCPVVASDIIGAREQMENAAILVDPKREDLFASAIAQLDETQRQDLIQKGHALAQRRTAQNYLAGLLETIDEIEPYRRCWSNETLWKHL
jgi:glycosyltransferase involved in cell wall biosynthesis